MLETGGGSEIYLVCSNPSSFATSCAAQTRPFSAMSDISWIFLRAGGAIPLRVEPHLKATFVAYQSLLLQLAALLPSHDAQGLGKHQREVVANAFSALRTVCRDALVDPASNAAPLATIHFLRTVARLDSGPLLEEPLAFENTIVANHATESPSEFRGSLACAEALYETCCRGQQTLRLLVDDEFLDAVDAACLWKITSAYISWAVALAFDGRRLYSGAQAIQKLASPLGDASVGIQSMKSHLLASETLLARRRLEATAAFFLAAAECGWKSYDPEGQLAELHETPRRVREALGKDLWKLRRTGEEDTPQPHKATRIVLSHFATLLERVSTDEGSAMLFQLALGIPCLSRNNLLVSEIDCPALLSVFDASVLVIELAAQELDEIWGFADAFCAVMYGVVSSSMACKTGPFRIACPAVSARIESIVASWPRSSSRYAGAKRPRPSDDDAARGKRVAFTETLARVSKSGGGKKLPRSTPLSNARLQASIALHTTGKALERHGGLSKPTDGVYEIKRLYFSALEHEVCETSGGSPFVNVALSNGSIAKTAIEAPWRCVVGGALLCSDPLYDFSRVGLRESLKWDWGEDKSKRLASVASKAVADRARKQVRITARAILKSASSGQRDEAASRRAVHAKRIVLFLTALADEVYASAEFSPIWDSIVSHLASVPPRARVTPSEPSPV